MRNEYLYFDCPSCKKYRHGPISRQTIGIGVLKDFPFGCPQENTKDHPHHYSALEIENLKQQYQAQL